MDNKSNKQNNSMFLYTALIFVVALLLILIAFFGQRNISNLREHTDNIAVTETQAPTEQATDNAANEELAKMTNKVSSLDKENTDLKSRLVVYDNLLKANKASVEGDIETAKAAIEEIVIDSLTEDQKVLYNQITERINE